jgi:hypothetical protein
MFTYSDNTYLVIIIWISIIFYCFNLIEISFIRQLYMCLMSVMEFSRAEYSADHRAPFRLNIRNLHYL